MEQEKLNAATVSASLGPDRLVCDAAATTKHFQFVSLQQRALQETSETSGTTEHWVAGAGERPIMGPNVLVSNLWEVRDFWEWLMPGHRESDKEHERLALPREARPLGRSLW